MLAVVLGGPPAHAHDWIYVARPGDNIWKLTEQHLKDIGYWEKLQAYNRITDPYRILPGTRLRIPIGWLKVQPASAHIIALSGRVLRIPANTSDAVLAAIGDELGSGDAVRTEQASSVTIEFADDSKLLVQAASVVVMDSMSAYGASGMIDTTMRLQQGRVESSVEKSRDGASRYQIITPTAVVAVRGTAFRSAYDATTGVALGEVSEGQVSARAGASTRRVNAGFGIRAEAGQPLAAPQRLLPAPNLSDVPRTFDRVLMQLRWPPVGDAMGYRVQVFAPGTSQDLLLDRRLDAPRLELDAPADGDYLLRVRAIDDSGLEGLDAEIAMTVDARPVPPALLEPRAQARVHGAPPELWWSQPENVVRYHVQVASDEAFLERLFDSDALAVQRHTLEREPAPGTYYWRVASISDDGERGPFGDAQAFRVLAVPEAPNAASSKVDAGRVVVSWGRSANATEYEFQLARDAEFKDLVVDEAVGATSREVAELEPDVYFYRARGVSDEGVKGPYSPANQFEIEGEPWSPAMLLILAPLLLL